MSIANADLEKFGTSNFIYAYQMDSESDRVTVKRCI